MHSPIHLGPSIKRCAIFAHFDADNIVDDYVLFYLDALKVIAEDIVFVSDCNLPPEELNKVGEIVTSTANGQHREYDFGSYKRGYSLIKEKLSEYDELIFCNDSCYGPLDSLEKSWSKAETLNADFWGLTWGRDPKFPLHLQSFFLVFKKQVFVSKVFESFVTSIGPERSKRDIIRKYEVGLTQLLLNDGFKAGATIEDNESENPPIHNPFGIIEKGFPFIKTALLRANPLGKSRLFHYKNYVKAPLMDFVKENLKRTAPNHEERMYYIYENQRLNIINRKFIYFKLSNVGTKTVIRIRFLGIQILKIKINSKLASTVK
jgi:lipopolysaccharide biosynthesis protein